MKWIGVVAFTLAAWLGAASAEAVDLVVNGDFTAGATGFTSGYVYGDVTPPGTYYVGTGAGDAPGHWSDWQDYHTPSGITGPMFIANGSNVAGTSIWSETVQVVAGTTYSFSFYGATQNEYTAPGVGDIQAQINQANVGAALSLPTNYGRWVQRSVTWTAGATGPVVLNLVDLDTSEASNDFTLDDISFQAGSGGTPGVPEPGAWTLMLFGTMALGAVIRGRRRAAGGETKALVTSAR